MNNLPLRIGLLVRSDDAKVEGFWCYSKRQGYSGKYREMQGNQRLSKRLIYILKVDYFGQMHIVSQSSLIV